MLALNAAIEAARAGDAGRGFAVAAREQSESAAHIASSVQQFDEVVQAILLNEAIAFSRPMSFRHGT